jgi:cobaltochelatase CobS
MTLETEFPPCSTPLSAAMIDRLANLNVPTLYACANACGLRGDYGRLYSPKAHGGVGTIRHWLGIAMYKAAGASEENMARIIDNVPPRPDKYKRIGTEPHVPPGGAPGGAVPNANAARDALKNLATVLGVQLGESISEEQLRGIIAEELDHLAPRAIEVTIGGTTHKIEERTHERFETLVRVINTRIDGRRMHAWLVGPSGSGKSHLAQQVAKASGLEYYTTGAVQTPFQLVGFISPSGNPDTLMTPFRRAFEFGGLFSWDDVDASDPRAFVAFNEALSNGIFAFPDRVVRAHVDFVCVASANTWGNGATVEYVGRNRIDGATLKRFAFITVDYDEAMERELCGQHKPWAVRVQKIRKSVAALGIKVLITPRDSYKGAALLAAGFQESEVERMTVFAGVDKDTEAKIRAGA